MRASFAPLGRWIALLIVLPGFSLNANPLQHSKRVVDERTVDLTPLFKWWTKKQGERPLKAWVHVTGRILSTNSLGWVIAFEGQGPGAAEASQAQAHAGPPTGRAVLKDPPLQDLVAFETLSRQLKALENQRAQLVATQSQARNRADTLGHSGVRSRAATAQARQARAVEAEAKREQAPIDQQIKALQQRLAAYPGTDQYLLDCFAMETTWQSNGLRVYEHGVPMN